MLKVQSIQFIDKDGHIYTINQNQIEFFPFIAGHESNIITTQVYNQHGESYIDSFLQSADGQLTFVIYTLNKTDLDIEKMRKEIVDICNPLRDIVQMKITLNSGTIYNQDIVFTSTPSFPIGLENRNQTWQKVQLFYRATNPFFYAEGEIVEDFSNVIKKFKFPFYMDETTNRVEFGTQTTGNVAINEGQTPAPVKITIKGACQNPRITNETTGEYMQFNNLVMTSGDTLEINTGFGEKKVTLNGASIFNKLDFSSTFFQLALGENVIKFTDLTNSTSVVIIFSYKILYIEI